MYAPLCMCQSIRPSVPVQCICLATCLSVWLSPQLSALRRRPSLYQSACPSVPPPVHLYPLLISLRLVVRYWVSNGDSISFPLGKRPHTPHTPTPHPPHGPRPTVRQHPRGYVLQVYVGAQSHNRADVSFTHQVCQSLPPTCQHGRQHNVIHGTGRASSRYVCSGAVQESPDGT